MPFVIEKDSTDQNSRPNSGDLTWLKRRRRKGLLLDSLFEPDHRYTLEGEGGRGRLQRYFAFGYARRPKGREATGVTEFRNQVLFTILNLIIIGYLLVHLI